MSEFSVQPAVALTAHNTLGCPAKAEYLTRCSRVEQLPQCLQWARERELPVHILGGGSNIVPLPVIPGLTIVMAIPGMHFEALDEDRVRVFAAAGQVWHDVVRESVSRGLYGLENLSAIPGLAGAAPIQNIGAYGVELADVLEAVHVYDPEVGAARQLGRTDCRFGYRDSLFKSPQGAHLIITGLQLILHRKGSLKLDYADLQAQFRASGAPPTPEAAAALIEQIRWSKLPRPSEVPNAGSFFKNPVVTSAELASLRRLAPDLIAHPVNATAADGGQANAAATHWKVAAGWLIEQTGWRGKIDAGTGTWHRQALVLVNPGRRDGHAVLACAERIRQAVADRFGLLLEQEPVCWGRNPRLAGPAHCNS